MKNLYITFGHYHKHSVEGKVLDKDAVAMIPCKTEEEGRAIARSYFSTQWAFAYFEEDWEEEELVYYPRGYVMLPHVQVDNLKGEEK